MIEKCSSQLLITSTIFAKEESFELTFELSTVFLGTLVLVCRYRHLGKECTTIATIKSKNVMRSTKFF